MRNGPPPDGQVVLACDELDATLSFLTDQLGFRLDAIMPADDPTVAELSGHGLRLRLDRGAQLPPGRIRLFDDDLRHRLGDTVHAPNGTVIDLAEPEPPLTLPPPAPRYELTRADDAAPDAVGRAAMRYRDLLPTRQGGRIIASHITIPDGGPVPDYVHHHRIRFQVIYCRRGWVRVVYEDQGPPFVLAAGDCVLQPPGIRHRVLESSPGLEVIEVTSPAEHATFVDHDLALPTADVRPDRVFGGQRFVHHRKGDAVWASWRSPGFTARDTGVGAGTNGLAEVRVVRAEGDGVTTVPRRHEAELLLWVITAGSATLRMTEQRDERLGTGDAVAIPAGLDHALADCSGDLELLEVLVAPGQ